MASWIFSWITLTTSNEILGQGYICIWLHQQALTCFWFCLVFEVQEDDYIVYMHK